MNLAKLDLFAKQGWKQSAVGTAAEIRNTLRLPISEGERENISGAYPYYGPTGILAHIDDFRIEGEHVLIGEDGDHFLKFRDKRMTLLVSGQFNVNNHAHVMRGTAKCLTKWLHYFFMHADLTPYLTRQGVGRFKLTKAALYKMPILLPPLPEQLKIAEMLSAWDEALEKLDALIHAKVRSKKALMQQLLSGQKRLKDFTSPWVKIRFSELLAPEDRYIEFDDEHVYNLVSVRRRSVGVFFREALKGSDIKTKVMKRVQRGDFLISRMQVVHGALGMVRQECDGMYASDSYEVLVAKDARKLHMPFLDWMSRRASFWNLAYICSHGVHIEKMTFNLKDFMKEEIFLPSDLKEQQAISAILDTRDAELQLLRDQRNTLDQQKRGLMQQLLTGKIRVNQP